jgi:hypothetical protein
MIIGTVRPEEARVFDQFAGYHRFHAETTQEEYGSFEIFWDDGDNGRNFDSQGELVKPGWYWWACSPGCVPDSDAYGPFASSRQALENADECHPEFDAEFEP